MRDYTLVSIIGSKLASISTKFPGVFPAAFLTVLTYLAANLPCPAIAAGAEIFAAHTEKLMPRVFQFDVTILHEGESPEHYVDNWEILDAQGEPIDTRKHVHPFALARDNPGRHSYRHHTRA